MLPALPDTFGEDLRAFLTHGLIVDPYLAGLDQEFFEYDSQDVLAQEADQLALTHWREPLRTQVLGASPAPLRIGRSAAHEILISTAATIAHEWRGRVRVTIDVAAEAIQRVRRFIATRGFGALVLVYASITFTENHSAVRHYGAIAEEDFVRGKLHRPWVRYPLDDELLAGLAASVYALEVRNGQRVVTETAAGEVRYQELRQLLESSGYLARRLQLISLSQFNLFSDWDAQAATIAPAGGAYRRAFTAFTGIGPGIAVLEAGCGMASQTFEGGLWDAVGPGGSIVGIDPAAGMLERAEAKAKQHRAKHVRFLRARAEDLSMFSDGVFDAAVGFAFLHFTDGPAALRELRRVTRPGGIVAVGGPCQLALDMPWFLEWFRPLLDLTHQHGAILQPLPGRIPASGEMRVWFAEAGLRDVVVDAFTGDWILTDPAVSVAFLIQGLSFFQQELELLPWQARQELLDELQQRGATICARTTPEERTLHWPTEFVKGTV